MNIIVLANAISPYKGSEYAVAWDYVTTMSKEHRLFVIYGGGKNKTDINAWLNNNSLDNVEFYYAGDHQTGIRWETSNKYYCYYQAFKKYTEWHKSLVPIAQDIIAHNQIDLIHYLNPIGFKEPGYLYKLNKPYIWGPTQGVENYPICLYDTMSLRGWIEGITRFLFLGLKLHFNSRIKEGVKRADVLISATPKTKKDFARYHHKDSLYLPENGILRIENFEPIKYAEKEKLQIISVGQLIDRKGIILQIKTAQKLIEAGYSNFIWRVFGTGYLEQSLKKEISKRELDNYFVLEGQVPRDVVQQHFNESHLNVISSLSEAHTTVIWEAMSKGLPTMSLNHCGMGGVLHEEDSILIPVERTCKVIKNMCNAIIGVLNNPSRIEQFSIGTINNAKNYTWDMRREVFNHLYALAVENYNSKKADVRIDKGTII